MSDSTMMNFLSRTKVALNISAPCVFKRKSEELLDEIFKADPNISSDTALIQLTREMSFPPSKDTVEAFLGLKRATLLKSSYVHFLLEICEWGYPCFALYYDKLAWKFASMECSEKNEKFPSPCMQGNTSL